MAGGSKAQTAECITSMLPCADYLKSGDPPASCCSPLRQAFLLQDKECLCSIFDNAPLLNSLGGATPADALRLPGRCGIPGASPSLCSSSPSPAPMDSPHSIPPTSGGNVLAWTGVSSLALTGVISYYLVFVFLDSFSLGAT